MLCPAFVMFHTVGRCDVSVGGELRPSDQPVQGECPKSGKKLGHVQTQAACNVKLKISELGGIRLV